MDLISPFHAEEIFTSIDSNREFLRTFLGWVDNTRTSNDVLEHIKRSLKDYAEMELLSYTVFNGKEVIGRISAWISNEDTRTIEIEYWIVKSESNKGIMTECTKRIMDLSFEYLKAEKVEIQCSTENIASNKLAKKLGYMFEGTLRNSEKVNNNIYDLNVYGMMKKEYK
jgi:ribosomal-protein-serine acetyltransferase